MKNAIIFQAILLICQGILYLGVQKFEGPAHDVKCRIDDKIPFWQPGVCIYALWYPLIAVFPLCLFDGNRELYVLYILSIIADIVISSIVYLAYPTSFQRPEPSNQGAGKLVSILHVCNYIGKNCMPSMHCSMCFIIAFFSALCVSEQVLLYGGFFLLAMAIIVSTVLIKQHVIIDVITGLLAAILSVSVAAWIQTMM